MKKYSKSKIIIFVSRGAGRIKMVKTDLTGINGVNQSLRHSKSEIKIARKQQAIKILSATGSNRRDSLSISDSARSFSKKSIAALIDSSANVSASELSFYFANYNNSSAILDAINFGENVSCGYNPDFKDYGVMDFDYNGIRQVVPNYAVPKINANSLSGIHAVNNSLVLKIKAISHGQHQAAIDTHGRLITEESVMQFRSRYCQRKQVIQEQIISARWESRNYSGLFFHRRGSRKTYLYTAGIR